MKKIALAAALAAFALPAVATTQDDVLASAFLPGWQTETGSRMTALHLQLAPGWKTYWRSPGDTGIPPQFDWTGSENLQSVTFHWPRPSVKVKNGETSVGYWGALVLPIEVKANDPAKPVVLRAQVGLGICLDICLPAEITLGATLAGAGAADPAILQALRARPDTAKQARVGKVSCRVDPVADGLRVTATVEVAPQGEVEAVVFEPGQQGVWVAQAVSRRDGGSLTAVTEMVAPSGAPFALDRSAITLTVLSPDHAVEIRGCPAP